MQRLANQGVRDAGFWPLPAVRIIMLGLLFVAVLPLAAQDKKDSDKTESGKGEISVGLMASDKAGAKEVGLPLYPGARLHKDKSDDSPAAQLGLWGGSSGFKLVVLKLESDDSPDKVATFYRKALAKYGKVLNCTGSSDAAAKKDKNKSSNELDCESDRPESGGILLKAGTKEKQHLVGINPNGSHSLFQLVYLESRGSDSEK